MQPRTSLSKFGGGSILLSIRLHTAEAWRATTEVFQRLKGVKDPHRLATEVEKLGFRVDLEAYGFAGLQIRYKCISFLAPNVDKFDNFSELRFVKKIGQHLAKSIKLTEYW